MTGGMKKVLKVKNIIAHHFPKPLFDIFVVMYIRWKKIRMPEEKRCFGELNPDKTFYVIRLYPPASGLLANYNYILGYMQYAYDRNWIPVVDMKNYSTLYSIGDSNIWELFFKQPYDSKTGKRYSLDEVYQSKHVILSDGSESFYNSELSYQEIHRKYELTQLVPFSNEIQNTINETYDRLFGKIESSKVIGIGLRGTDLQKRHIGHAIQLTAQTAIPLLRERKKQWNADYIFANADEQSALEELKVSFPELIYTNTERAINYSYEKDINAAFAISTNNQYLSLKNYIVNVYLLSKCDCLIGSFNNGILTACIWNNGCYDMMEIVDYGKYK